MNLRVLTKSRRRLAAGDIFAALPPDGQFIFGRVISTTAKAGPSMPAILIYIFNLTLPIKEPPEPHQLIPSALLIPPVMTNRRAWTEGYFETIANRPFGPGEILPRHCFRSSTGRFYDEMARELSSRIEPCGEWGLNSFRTIDDEISAALGIPLSPD